MVAFDPLGTGKDEYIARHVMSFNYNKNENNYHELQVSKASNCYKHLNTRLDYPKHLEDELRESEIENFISVTAGDYDGDGRDEVAIYDISAYYGRGNEDVDSNQMGVIRIYDYGSGSTISLPTCVKTISLTNYSGSHPRNFINNKDSRDITYSAKDYVGVQMTTAHLVGGYECEDLILTLNYNSDEMASRGDNGSRVLVFEGSQLSSSPKIDTGHIEGLDNQNRKLRAASTVVGDVDNDGKTDVIIAGLYSELNNGQIHCDGEVGDNNSEIQKNYIAAFEVNDDENQLVNKNKDDNNEKDWQLVNCKPYKLRSSKEGASYKFGNIAHPVSIVPFAVDGINSADLIFLNGRVFIYSQGGVFEDQNVEADWDVYYNDDNDDFTFIGQAVAGNMINDDIGREMVIFTYGSVDGNKDGYDHAQSLGIGTMFYDAQANEWELGKKLLLARATFQVFQSLLLTLTMMACL